MRNLISAEDPDFLAFTGDMVAGGTLIGLFEVQDTAGTKLPVGTRRCGTDGRRRSRRRRFSMDTL